MDDQATGEALEAQHADDLAGTLQDDVVHAVVRGRSRAESALEVARQRAEDVLAVAGPAQAHRRVRGGALDGGARRLPQLQAARDLVPQAPVEDGRGGVDQGDGGAARALVGEQAGEEPADDAAPSATKGDGDVEQAVRGHLATADPHSHRQGAGQGDREATGGEGAHDPRSAACGRPRIRAAPGVAEGPALDGEVLAPVLLAQWPEREPACGNRRRRRHDHRRLPSPGTTGRTAGAVSTPNATHHG